MWRLRQHNPTVFSQKFCQINVLPITKERYCKLNGRNKHCRHSFLAKIPSYQRFTNYVIAKEHYCKSKFLDAGIQDVSTSISIVHNLIEISPDEDGDESDKHI